MAHEEVWKQPDVCRSGLVPVEAETLSGTLAPNQTSILIPPSRIRWGKFGPQRSIPPRLSSVLTAAAIDLLKLATSEEASIAT